jgi:hypothetical protein
MAPAPMVHGGADGEHGGADGEGGTPGTAPWHRPGCGEGAHLHAAARQGEGRQATGDDGDVVVTLTPLDLLVRRTGRVPTDTLRRATTRSARFLALRNWSAAATSPLALCRWAVGGRRAVRPMGGEGKFWSARYGTYGGLNSLAANRATVSVTAGTDAGRHVDSSSDVPLRRSLRDQLLQARLRPPVLPGHPSPTTASRWSWKSSCSPAEGALGGDRQRAVRPARRCRPCRHRRHAHVLGHHLHRGDSSLGGGSSRASPPPPRTPITATLDGYGTAVAQITLGCRRAAPPTCRSACATVSARSAVSSRGADGPHRRQSPSLPPATASTRTTTSLTAGATGSYLFPELEIPGTYTVTAAARATSPRPASSR